MLINLIDYCTIMSEFRSKTINDTLNLVINQSLFDSDLKSLTVNDSINNLI